MMIFLFFVNIFLELFDIAIFPSNDFALEHIKGGDGGKIIFKLAPGVAINDAVFYHARVHIFDDQRRDAEFLIFRLHRNEPKLNNFWMLYRFEQVEDPGWEVAAAALDERL